jgi:hypothetical protein
MVHSDPSGMVTSEMLVANGKYGDEGTITNNSLTYPMCISRSFTRRCSGKMPFSIGIELPDRLKLNETSLSNSRLYGVFSEGSE